MHATSLTAPAVLRSATRAATPFDPIAQWSQATEQHRALWLRPDRHQAIVALGAAWQTPAGFTTASQAWHELVRHADIADPVETPGSGPVLIGGFRFDPLARPTSLWSGFASDRLVLPERAFFQHGNQAWLTTNHCQPSEPPLAEPLATPATGLDPEAWQHLVERIARGIREREVRVDKVVLARTEQKTHTSTLEAALRQLAHSYPSCTIFAIANGEAVFVGATPERLVSVHDGVASTMALAGTSPRGRDADEDAVLAERLRNDPKERAEHDFVVQALRRGLRQVCTRVIADAEPRVRTLANLQHLLTPIRGQLAPGKSILDVLEQLHPSPAVGGVPSSAALEIIRAEERLDRGWYGGPIGWLDARGQGEFVVAIRSALLRGSQATLFAGCGIVADSDAATELAESRWKLRPMQSALGIQPQA